MPAASCGLPPTRGTSTRNQGPPSRLTWSLEPYLVVKLPPAPETQLQEFTCVPLDDFQANSAKRKPGSRGLECRCRGPASRMEQFFSDSSRLGQTTHSFLHCPSFRSLSRNRPLPSASYLSAVSGAHLFVPGTFTGLSFTEASCVLRPWAGLGCCPTLRS